jgi:hypothetical protein
MAITTINRDVYFIRYLNSYGVEILVSLYAHYSAIPLNNLLYVGNLYEPDSEEVFLFEWAEDLPALRQRMDQVIESIGSIAFCYRDAPSNQFEWFP